jgi:hypothetical protein
MLDLLEKIGLALCALFLLGTIVLYAVLKIPSTQSLLWIPSVVDAKPEPKPAANTSSANSGPAAPSAEDQAILQKLAEQDRKFAVTQLVKEPKNVPQQLFEYLSAEANLLPSLKTAKSKPISTRNGQTRLQVFGIDPQSVLGKLGFKENDVIELVDGQIIEFKDSNSTKYYEMWRAAKERLRAGKPISVTVTRNNRPVHLEFSLPPR